MQKPQWFSLRVLALTLALGVLVLSAGLHAIADTTGSWMGQVVYVNNRHIGVKSQAQTRDFLLDANTIFLENGKPAELKDNPHGIDGNRFVQRGHTIRILQSAAGRDQKFLVTPSRRDVTV